MHPGSGGDCRGGGGMVGSGSSGCLGPEHSREELQVVR
jgi:hypothetical protein